MRIVLRGLGFVVMLVLAGFVWSYAEATSTPIVRRGWVEMAAWPDAAPPVKVLLISDIHVAGPDMPPSRLARIVAQINALDPDIVLVAGDLISEKRFATRYYSMAEAIAPLGRLRSRLGVYAVLGNHDHWADARGARVALDRAGIELLENDAVVAGPLVVGGLDDDFTGRDDLARTLSIMRKLRGAPVLLSHSPDPFPNVPRGVGLMLAGHTHCGQVAPWPIGPLATASRHGERYACGIIRENGRTLIVSAGLGTSILPLRLGAPPDMWLLELGPHRKRPS